MTELLVFDISDLKNKPLAFTESYNFQVQAQFPDIILKSDLQGELEIMKVDDGLNVRITNMEIDVELECFKCLTKIIKLIKIPVIERKFLFAPPKIVEDPFDLFVVDLKHQQIDLNEIIRQEIILHFPTVSVCSKSCKGICSVCGKNKNEEECSCKVKDEEIEANKPFSKLKDLLK